MVAEELKDLVEKEAARVWQVAQLREYGAPVLCEVHRRSKRNNRVRWIQSKVSSAVMQQLNAYAHR